MFADKMYAEEFFRIGNLMLSELKKYNCPDHIAILCKDTLPILKETLDRLTKYDGITPSLVSYIANFIDTLFQLCGEKNVSQLQYHQRYFSEIASEYQDVQNLWK